MTNLSPLLEQFRGMQKMMKQMTGGAGGRPPKFPGGGGGMPPRLPYGRR